MNDSNQPSDQPQALFGQLFHDVTTSSLGVLADTRHGGLKKDLTAAFATDQAFADFISEEGSYVFDNPFGNGITGPNWRILRDYHNLYRELDDPSDDIPAIAPRSYGPDPVEWDDIIGDAQHYHENEHYSRYLPYPNAFRDPARDHDNKLQAADYYALPAGGGR